MDGLKQSVAMWMTDHSIKGFYSVAPSKSGFKEGAVAQINLAGLGMQI